MQGTMKDVIVTNFNDKQLALGGNTYKIRDLIRSAWGGVWSAPTKRWVMPDTFKTEILDNNHISYVIGNQGAVAVPDNSPVRFAVSNMKALVGKDTYKYKDRIIAAGGKWDAVSKVWHVPMDFDDSFLSDAKNAPQPNYERPLSISHDILKKHMTFEEFEREAQKLGKIEINRICGICRGNHYYRSCKACYICAKVGHNESDCKCSHCGVSQMYHYTSDCPTINPRYNFTDKNHGCLCTPFSRTICKMCTFACCKEAEKLGCTCDVSFICGDHNPGERQCKGSHF